MKNRFWYIAFMVALTIHPCMGMDVSNTKEFSQSDWEFKGDFQEIKEPTLRNSRVNRDFTARNKNKTDYIKAIKLVGCVNGDIQILIQYHSENIQQALLNLSKTMKSIGALDEFEGIWISPSDQEKAFLQSFYTSHLIPDFIMNRLLKELNWEDLIEKNL